MVVQIDGHADETTAFAAGRRAVMVAKGNGFVPPQSDHCEGMRRMPCGTCECTPTAFVAGFFAEFPTEDAR